MLMSKHYQDPRRIASAAAKRRCSARVGVPFIDTSFRNQASGLPPAPETYQAVSMPSEPSQQDLLSSTSTIPPVLAYECQYWQNISTIESDPFHLHSASQNVRGVHLESAAGRLADCKQDQSLQPRKAEKAGCSRYSSDIRFGTADATYHCYNNHSSLQNISTPYPSLSNEPSLRQPHDRVYFASHSNLQRPETSFIGGMICFSPWQNLTPVELLDQRMQDKSFSSLLPDEQAWHKHSAWPITQANGENLAKRPKYTHRENGIGCIITDLIQLENRLRDNTQQQLAEIKCSFHGSPCSIRNQH